MLILRAASFLVPGGGGGGAHPLFISLPYLRQETFIHDQKAFSLESISFLLNDTIE